MNKIHVGRYDLLNVSFIFLITQLGYQDLSKASVTINIAENVRDPPIIQFHDDYQSMNLL
jgi:hypothetical protein